MGHLRDEQHGKGMVVHMLRVAWEAGPVVVTELTGVRPSGVCPAATVNPGLAGLASVGNSGSKPQ